MEIENLEAYYNIEKWSAEKRRMKQFWDTMKTEKLKEESVLVFEHFLVFGSCPAAHLDFRMY